MSLISCEHVSLGYEGQKIIEDVDFSLNGGEYLVIVGENGAGKSTLMKGLLRLKKPMEGKICYGEELKPNEIGYLPQQTDVQKDFPASVKEVILSGCLNQLGFRPFYGQKEKLRAKEAMEMMDITDLAKVSFQDLSGGQKQRVLLARALCATTKVLLMDEPVAGLDPIATKELYELIARINREMHITIIMVSHDLETALQYATHILHLSQKQTYFGLAEDFLETNAGANFAQISGGDELWG